MLTIKNWLTLNFTTDLQGRIIRPIAMQNQNLFESISDDVDLTKIVQQSDITNKLVSLNINNTSMPYILYWHKEVDCYNFFALQKPATYEEILHREQAFSISNSFLKISITIDAKENIVRLHNSTTNHDTTFDILNIISIEENPLNLDFAGRTTMVSFFSSILENQNPLPIMFKSNFYNNKYHLFLVSAKKSAVDSNTFVCETTIVDEYLDKYKQIFPESIYYEAPKVIYRPTFIGFINNYFSIDQAPGLFCVLDVDNFSLVNNKYTYRKATEILNLITNNLTKYICKIGSITHLLEDKLVFFLPGLHNDLEICKVLTDILDIVRNVEIDGVPAGEFTATIGGALSHRDGNDFDTLLSAARTALIKGKYDGKDRYSIFNTNVAKYSRNTSPDFTTLNFYKDFMHELVISSDLNKTVNKTLDMALHFFNLNRILMYCQTVDEEYHFVKFTNAKKAIGVKRQKYEVIYHFVKDLQPMVYVDTSSGSSELIDFLKSKLHFEKGYIVHIFEEGKYFSVYLVEGDELSPNDEEMFKNLIYSTLKSIDNFVSRCDILNRQLITLNKDNVTDLATFSGFALSTKAAIAKNPGEFTLLAFDIKNFSFINDFYGFSVGDSILKFIGINIKKILNKNDSVCHAAADRFLILIHTTNKEQIEKLKNLIFSDIRYYKMKDATIHLHYNIGAYILGLDDDIHHSIDKANKARISSKRDDFTTLTYFTAESNKKDKLDKRIELIAEKALNNNEFYPVFQPCYDVVTKRITSAEALVRWNHKGENFYPNDFIPYFEKSGMIIKMDFIIFEEVLRLLKSWKACGKTLIPISVNVSRAHLLSGDFVEKLIKLVSKYDIERKYLCLEITESMFAGTGQNGYHIIQELHEKGFNIYLDDFGTAYSNLNSLSEINFDVIKIDKSLVDNIHKSDKALTIFKSVVSMSKALGLKILVEGVEYQKQLDIAIAEKCDIIQGYIFSKPVKINTFNKKIDAN